MAKSCDPQETPYYASDFSEKHSPDYLKDPAKWEVKKFQKYDTGKLRWLKFPWRAAAAVLRIMHFGATKYAWDNWRSARGEDNERMLEACCRHIIKHINGEVIDPESNYPHIWHAGCTLMMYIDNKERSFDELDEAKPTTAPGRLRQHHGVDCGCASCMLISYGAPPMSNVGETD